MGQVGAARVRVVGMGALLAAVLAGCGTPVGSVGSGSPAVTPGAAALALGAPALNGEPTDPAFSRAIAGLTDRSPRGLCDLAEREDAAGNAAASQILGDCYFQGIGGRARDGMRAMAAYQRAADGGRVTALCSMGNMLVRGDLVPQDVSRGIALCRRAADAGSANAQTDLAGYYLMGQGVSRDPAEARRLLSRAAAQGQANAQFGLGLMARDGVGGPADSAEAQRLLLAAARGGQRSAPFALSQMASRRATTGAAATSGGGRAVDQEALLDAVFWAGVAERVEPDPARRGEAARLVETFRPVLARALPDLGARLEARRRSYLGG